MIIDSSALIAIFLWEPEREDFLSLILEEKQLFMSVVNKFESAMVSTRLENGMAKLDDLLLSSKIKIVPVSLNQGELARQAFIKYGKGRHKAALNMGDCFAYALAKEKKMKLLAKGNDFRLTDIKLAQR